MKSKYHAETKSTIYTAVEAEPFTLISHVKILYFLVRIANAPGLNSPLYKKIFGGTKFKN